MSLHKTKKRTYCLRTIDSLIKRPVVLFLCCLSPEEEARDYFQKNFPLPLVEHAKATGVLGGALYFEKMNVIERFLLKKISGKTDSFEDIREERIRDFVRQFEG